MLQFNSVWRFRSPGPISTATANAFSELINRIVAQGDRKRLLEHFKGHFAGAAGTQHFHSSDVSWAHTDLMRLIDEASQNAPLFIEALYDACTTLRERYPEMGIPEVRHLNQILAGNNDLYEIDPPDLKAAHAGATVTVPEPPASLELQAQKLIEASLNASDQLLSEGRGRQAVQELLWLLESVSTAFRGLSLEAGSIQGRYFNKIIAEIRGREKGTSLDQILNWMLALHGYLSSPTGGGIRHGTDVRNGIEFQLNDARLYCNLVRSYITYLVGEYDRLQRDLER